ncbi:hypothetical protein [Metamycoplasma equirhinis]
MQEIKNNKSEIDLTNWNVAIDFLASKSNSKTRTKEYYINQLKKRSYKWN